MTDTTESPATETPAPEDHATEPTGIFATEDPYALARAWLAQAEKSEPNDPNAMGIATVDADGLPNLRVVLLKEIEDDPLTGGFVFYTNYEGAKGRELEGQPRAAGNLHWKSLQRQLRLRGPVERVEGAPADAYYASRAYKSRIGAWASAQSRPLASRAALMAKVAATAARYPLNPPRPPHWGGFRIRPVEIEFWADGAFRLHDRFQWRRDTPDSANWTIRRLNP
ncbi:MAG: pyridoxamine 5'-phosphate oxidase [Pseudomonadota bacterium]